MQLSRLCDCVYAQPHYVEQAVYLDSVAISRCLKQGPSGGSHDTMKAAVMMAVALCVGLLVCSAHASTCERACSSEYNPVCGSNGFTYPNECKLQEAACENQVLRLVHDGECGQHHTRLQGCPSKCRPEYFPVCGSDFVTYTNLCEFQEARCKQVSLLVAYVGKCEPQRYVRVW